MEGTILQSRIRYQDNYAIMSDVFGAANEIIPTKDIPDPKK